MHLKSVEIVGFKSFADKTRVELKPGITGIVGPNGCGKTNVMEAIRWCLGEMSWKSLRSPSMVDVIFNGNTRRKPLSMAEVTLTFDNSESALPVQYTEITVTRRIFRSGESEYLLNKTACRLKDIRELFLDTGIGGDGYAIIDQGGVDFVLNSKPEDRRSLFEEAAGVAKYRAKREEALRKLERVEADLARLQDSIALINEQIKKLDSDARKAKLYQKYKEELAAQEAGQLLKEIGAISAETEKEAALIEPVRQNLENRKVDFDGAEGRLSAARLELTHRQAEAAELDRKIAAVKADIARYQERIEHAKKGVQDLRQRKEKEQAEMESARRRLSELDPEMERARSALDQAGQGAEAARKEAEEFGGRLKELEAGIEAAEREIADLRGQFTAAAQAGQDAARRLSDMERELMDHVHAARQALKDLIRSAAEADSVRAELETRGQEAEQLKAALAERQAVLSEREAARRAKSEALAAVNEELVNARAESAALEARLEMAQERGGQDPYWIGAQAVLAAEIPGVLGTFRSLITVEPGFERFVEDVLGERLYSLVCEDLTAAQNAIEFLERSQKGRARMLVLSSLPESVSAKGGFPPQAKPLMARLQWDSRIQTAVQLLLSECYCLGQSLYGDYWISGGAEPQGNQAARPSSIEAWRDGLAAVRTRVQTLADRRSSIETELHQAEEAAREAAAAVHSESGRWAAHEADQRSRASRLESLRQDESLWTNDAARTLAEIARVKEEMLSVRTQAEERRAEENRVSGLQNEALQRLNAMRGEFSARKTQGDALKKGMEQWESQLRVLQDQCGRLSVEEETLKGGLARRQADIAEIDQQTEHYGRTEAESKGAIERFHEELAKGEVASQGFSANLSALRITIETMEQSVKDLGAECKRLDDQVRQWELKAGELKVRRESLTGRLWDEWQLSAEEAGAKYPQVDVDPEKIQTLRRRIQNMGNINLAAPEEYEALTQKHQFFLSQVEDLSKAKEDLRQAIQKINATTREQFRQTFTEVRGHFQRIYGALFEGGEADLVLTDQENLLETGIDIVAQPPGKRLQSITLLSGGERTLTAIALLFAFFMVKPSPMCMLDEADAALDEANVGRFAGMLREFSIKSQFLIISHNKKTMAAADQIYGVTMEESGISQLISVDFQPKVDPSSPASPAAVSQQSGGAETA